MPVLPSNHSPLVKLHIIFLLFYFCLQGDITPIPSQPKQIIVKTLPSVKAVPKTTEDVDVESLEGDLSGRSTPAEGQETTEAQAKANRIIQEAIAKAEAEGRPIPKVCAFTQSYNFVCKTNYRNFKIWLNIYIFHRIYHSSGSTR